MRATRFAPVGSGASGIIIPCEVGHELKLISIRGTFDLAVTSENFIVTCTVGGLPTPVWETGVFNGQNTDGSWCAFLGGIPSEPPLSVIDPVTGIASYGDTNLVTLALPNLWITMDMRIAFAGFIGAVMLAQTIYYEQRPTRTLTPERRPERVHRRQA